MKHSEIQLSLSSCYTAKPRVRGCSIYINKPPPIQSIGNGFSEGGSCGGLFKYQKSELRSEGSLGHSGLTQVEVVLHAVAEDQDTGDGVNDGY